MPTVPRYWQFKTSAGELASAVWPSLRIVLLANRGLQQQVHGKGRPKERTFEAYTRLTSRSVAVPGLRNKSTARRTSRPTTSRTAWAYARNWTL